MPRINELEVTILTGDVTPAAEFPVKFAFNGHAVEFSHTRGRVAAGEVFEGRFAPGSFAHSVQLYGPPNETWDITRIDVTYKAFGDPWTVSFGPITLDAETAVDIWADPPQPAWDV